MAMSMCAPLLILRRLRKHTGMSLALQVSIVTSELGKPVTEDPPRARWLLLIYRVPQDPPGPRTYAWRQLKQLGAIYLQQAAAILPDRPDRRTALEALA